MNRYLDAIRPRMRYGVLARVPVREHLEWGVLDDENEWTPLKLTPPPAQPRSPWGTDVDAGASLGLLRAQCSELFALAEAARGGWRPLCRVDPSTMPGIAGWLVTREETDE